MYLATAEQMKRIDGTAINGMGIPSLKLMENAAAGIVGHIETHFGGRKLRAAIFCGSGNNGGDGACAALMLLKKGHEVKIFLVGRREKFSPDMAEMCRRFESIGGVITDFSDTSREFTDKCDVIIDAMFGVGLNAPIRGNALKAVELINSCKAYTVSADIASGVSADSGEILGIAVHADATVTFSMAKPGHFVSEGAVCCGELIIHDIGIPPEAMAGEVFNIAAFNESDLDKIIPIRPEISHKGDFGKVLIISGSIGFTGAPTLCARAAVRCGSGLVSLAVPDCVYPIVAAANTEVMVSPLPSEDGKISAGAIEALLEKMRDKDVIIIGPGLGRGEGVCAVVGAVIENASVPVVVDADGINALSENIDILKKHGHKLILTPHDGEFARLGGKKEGSRIAGAAGFSAQYGCVLALKGHHSLTAVPDGRVWINTTGNNGMSTGGTGDVLTGIIASLVGQGISPENATSAGQYILGRAGDICAEEIGQYGMIPSDTIERIPAVLKKYQKESE